MWIKNHIAVIANPYMAEQIADGWYARGNIDYAVECEKISIYDV